MTRTRRLTMLESFITGCLMSLWLTYSVFLDDFACQIVENQPLAVLLRGRANFGARVLWHRYP